MEGTSYANNMRLLQRKNRESFLISFGPDLVFGGKKSDTINYRSILGIIEEDRVMVRLQVISKQSLCWGQTLNSNLWHQFVAASREVFHLCQLTALWAGPSSLRRPQLFRSIRAWDRVLHSNSHKPLPSFPRMPTTNPFIVATDPRHTEKWPAEPSSGRPHCLDTRITIHTYHRVS
jgi:hypothetical protein